MLDTISERDASAGSDAAAREDELAAEEAISGSSTSAATGIAPPRHRRHADSRGHLGCHRVSQRGRLPTQGFSQSSGILTCGISGRSTR